MYKWGRAARWLQLFVRDRVNFEMSSSASTSATGSFQNQTHITSDQNLATDSVILLRSVRKRKRDMTALVAKLESSHFDSAPGCFSKWACKEKASDTKPCNRKTGFQSPSPI